MNTRVYRPRRQLPARIVSFRTAARSPWRRRPALSTLALLIGSALAAPAAYANPAGGTVVAGSAVIGGSGNTVDIRQSSGKAIIDWRSFGIGAGETVNFLQPSSSAVTLNRVLGNDPSAIFGRLNANGTVMLVNPNGIVFGPTAVVDVGGLVATTANIRNEDFLAGRYAFDLASPNADAAVSNFGTISIRDSGLAALVAPSVSNAGVIEARLGRVALGGAQTFTLDFQGDGLLSFDATSVVGQLPKDADGKPVDALVANSGQIRADGGTVLLTASAMKDVVDGVVNVSGIVQARSVESRNGVIVLSGGRAGTVAVSGTLDASAPQAGSTGGKVVVDGQHVQIAGSARIDASGAASGGEIALGSRGLAGTAPADATPDTYADKAETLTVAAGARLAADALDSGNGGAVTLWSTDTTRFDGQISARGGAHGGDGGFAEVSSLANIGLEGDVDLRADHGRAGMLLLDPQNLTIVDGASGGSQDSGATDGTIGVTDGDAGSGSTLNTISRGKLESLAGNANITLEASGLITVGQMADNLINLQTTAGHSFTLRSTLAGGIVFADSATEIRTQGGSITLEALGRGATLSNIGKLTTNGGDVTLMADGSITLGGAIDATGGSGGNIVVNSANGAIANAAGATGAVLSGASVTLSAAKGSVGANGSAINTATRALALTTGGSLYVDNGASLLSTLAVTSSHASAGAHDNTYSIQSSGLAFNVSDGSSYLVQEITGSLDISFTGDQTISIGTVNVGSGYGAFRATSGNITGLGGNGIILSASTTLQADAANSYIDSIQTNAGVLQASAGSGGISMRAIGGDYSTMLLSRIASTGDVTITTDGGNIVAGSVTATGHGVTLSTLGNILDDGDASTTITGNNITLIAGGTIGSSASHINATLSAGGDTTHQITAIASGGGLYADLRGTGSGTLATTLNAAGPIVASGAATGTFKVFSAGTDGLAGQDIALSAASGTNIALGAIDAGALGNVAVTAAGGAVNAVDSSSQVSGANVMLTGTSGVGAGTQVAVATSTLNVSAGTGNARIRLLNPTTIASVTSGANITLNAAAGADLTIGTIAATGTSGSVTIAGASDSSAYDLFDDGDTATGISAPGSISISAHSLGTSANWLDVATPSLTLTTWGNMFVADSLALNSLAITSNHMFDDDGAIANTLRLTAPYLDFNVTDLGNGGGNYRIDRLVSGTLGAISFTGDRDIYTGQIQGNASANVTITAGGDMKDDGDANTRVTGNTVKLTALYGSVGHSGTEAIDVNTADLTIDTTGDTFVDDVADLSSLTLRTHHVDGPDIAYSYVIKAPSLVFDLTDSTDHGYAFNHLIDLSGLNFTFTGDRNIMLGDVNVARSGSLNLTSSTGTISDDGNLATQTLADAITLHARGNIGSGNADSGASNDDGALHLVAQTINATSDTANVSLVLDMPTDSAANTTRFYGSAAGNFYLHALQGNLQLYSSLMAGYDKSIDIIADRGSILAGGQMGFTSGAGTFNLTAYGSIGSSSGVLYLSSSGTLNAHADKGVINIGGGGSLTVDSAAADDGAISIYSDYALTANNVIAANGSIDLSSGATLTVGTVAAGGQAVTLSAGQAIVARDATSMVSGSSVALYGTSLGTSAQALQVDTPALLASVYGSGSGSESDNGSINISDISELTSLSLDLQSNYTYDSTFSISAPHLALQMNDDGSLYYLQSIGSSDGPLAFSFRGNHDIRLGSIQTNGGSADIGTSFGNIANDGNGGINVEGRNVTLSTSYGSIGAGGSSGAITLSGTSALSMAASGNFYVTDDRALTDLALNSTAGATAAVNFGITTVSGQTIAIDDQVLAVSGRAANSRAQTLNVYGGGLEGFSFSTSKNILVGRVEAADSVSLSTSSGSSYGNTIRMATSGTGIKADAVSLSALNSYNDAVLNGIGNGTGSPLLVETRSLDLTASGSIAVRGTEALQHLGMTVSHTNYNVASASYTYTPVYSYSVVGTGISNFSVADAGNGLSTTLTNVSTSSPLDFSFTSDRALTVGTIDVGSAGTVTLTSRGSYQSPTGSFPAPSILGSSGNRITAGSVTLSAANAYGSVGGSGTQTINTTTKNLSITSAANVYVSNNSALDSLSLTANVSNGGNAPTYSIASTGLTSSIGYDFTYGLRINTLTTTNDTAFNIGTNTTLTLGTISTGANGSVALKGSSIQGFDDSSKITTRDLTLNTNGSVGVYARSTPLQTQVSSLAGTVSGNLYLSNSGDLTLHGLTLGTATIRLTDGGSFLSDGAFYVSASNLTLDAGTGIIGQTTSPILVDTPNLTLVSGGDITVFDRSDLYSLDVTANHTTAGDPSQLTITAPQLTFDIDDQSTGSTNLVQVTHVTDESGIDFNFTSDGTVKVGNVDGRNGRNVGIRSSLGTVENGVGEYLHGDNVTLWGQLGVGTQGAIQTEAWALNVRSAGDIHVSNARDLVSLSLTSDQTGNAGQTFDINVPNLVFEVADDGTTTHVNDVTDSTGLNFNLTSYHQQSIGNIGVQDYGTVGLTGYNGIFSKDASETITAARLSLTTVGGGTAGSVANPLYFTAPILSMDVTGDIHVVSRTHLDAINLTTENTSGSYQYDVKTDDGITSRQILSGTNTALDAVTDESGLDFTYASWADFSVGNIDLGGLGWARLTAYRGSISGQSSNLIDAGSLTLNATYAGGGIGTGTALQTTALEVSAQANTGGINLALQGASDSLATLSNTSAYGAINVTNAHGDLALGTVTAYNNTVSIGNNGGSIVSGTINYASTLTLNAAGSVGNQSAISTRNYYGGVNATILNVQAAANGRGATGSVNLSESSGSLNLNDINAPGNITIGAAYGLSIGSITGATDSSSAGNVNLTAKQGSILANNTSNKIIGSSVSLTANDYSAAAIGSSSAAINVTTPVLSLQNSGAFYVNDSIALTDLTITRTNTLYGSGSGPSGTGSIIAANMTSGNFSYSDNSSSATLGKLTASSPMNLTLSTLGRLNVGTLNVGSTGSATLSTAYSFNGSMWADGAIYGQSGNKITAGTLAMTTGSYDGATGGIGLGYALNLDVGTLTATTQQGGVNVVNDGSVYLDNIQTTGSATITAKTGDLTVGALSYGSSAQPAATLSLKATAGKILAGSGTGITSSYSGGTGAITLTAATGIGSDAAPLRIAAANAPITATTTGAGDIGLNLASGSAAGLTATAANGSIGVTSGSSVLLTNLRSTSDAAGNDISVTATSGNITVANVQAGANAGHVSLSAGNGYILGSGTASVVARDIDLSARYDIGSTATRLSVGGQHIDAASGAGALYLGTADNAGISYLETHNKTIDLQITGSAYLANMVSGNGAINVATAPGTTSRTVLGNIDAGTGSVTIDATAGSPGTRLLVDDGLDGTRITGSTVTLKGTSGIGSADRRVQTTAGTLVLDSKCLDTYLDNDRAAGVTIGSATGRMIDIVSAGPTTASSIVTNNAVDSGIKLYVADGDLTLGTLNGGADNGAVTLQAAHGRILAGAPGTNVTAKTATLTASGGIGTISDLQAGTASPITIAATTLGGLTATDQGSAIAVSLIGNATLAGGTISLADAGQALVSATGNLDVSAGIDLKGNGSLSLEAGTGGSGTLKVPTADFNTTGTLRLVGKTDVVAGASGRTIGATASSIVFESGGSGGPTLLNTVTAALTAALHGTNGLTVSNTGDLTATLSSDRGSLSAVASGALTVTSANVGDGVEDSLTLIANGGDLTVDGAITAGSGNGIATLTANGHSLVFDGASPLSARVLSLTSQTGIGSADTAFQTNASDVTVHVTGDGGINVATTAATSAMGATIDGTGDIALAGGATLLTLRQVATGDGDVSASAGSITSSTGITAGSANAGNITLAASGTGTVDVQHDLTTSGDVSMQGGTIKIRNVQTVVGGVFGDQTYTGNLTIGGNLAGGAIAVHGNATLAGNYVATVNGAGNDLQIDGTLNGGGFSTVLTNADGGSVVIGGNATNLAALDVDASDALVRSVTTSGHQSYSDDVTLNGSYIAGSGDFTVGGKTLLGGDSTVVMGSGTAVFQDTIDSADSTARSLGVTGAASFGGEVGATHQLASLSAGNSSFSAGLVSTTGAQSFGSVTLNTDLTLDAGGTVQVDGAVQIGSAPVRAYDLTVDAGADAFFIGEIGAGTTHLRNLIVNANGSTVFGSAVQAATLSTDAGGQTRLYGNVTTTGNQSYGDLVLLYGNAVLTAPLVRLAAGADAPNSGAYGLTITGDADITGNVGANYRLASLSVSGATDLHAAEDQAAHTVATTGAQTYGGALSFDADASLSTTGGAIAFHGTVDGAHDLHVSAASGGVAFDRAVGAGDALGNLTVDTSGLTQFGGAVTAASITTDGPGTLAINGGSVDTTGAQSYGERAVLGADTTLTGSTITLAQGVDAATAGQQSLTIAGNADITGALGASGKLESLAIYGNADLRGSGNISTAGAQEYGDAVTLHAAKTLTADAGNIRFYSPVDGGYALTVNATDGSVAFSDAIGSGTRLGALTVNASDATVFDGAIRAASVATDAAGTLAINGGSVDTTGTQSYGERAVLGNDTTLTGSTVTLAHGADAANAGQQSLTITADADIAGDVGALGALEALSVSGSTALRAAGGHTPQSIVTTGGQTYTGAVTLWDSSSLSAGGAVAFHDTVDGAVNGTSALTVSAGTYDVGFDAAVGSTHRLGALTVDTGGATRFSGAVTAASVATDAAGTLAIDGGLVDTTGNQSYGERVVLGGSARLKGDTVILAQGIDAATEGGASLNIDADADITGNIGAVSRLDEFAIQGSAQLRAADGQTAQSIATTGGQSYYGAVTLGADTAVTAGTGSVGFENTVDGSHALTVTVADGNAYFTGAVGSGARLGDLEVYTPGGTFLLAAIDAASVATDAAGSLIIGGGSVNTTGDQSYGEHAQLSDDTSLTGAHVILGQGVDATDDGAYGLAITGDADITGNVGAVGRLASLDISGATALHAADGETTHTVSTTGAQSYGGALTLDADESIASGGGGIAFHGTVDGGTHDLTVSAGAGNIGFDRAVGGAARLGDLAVTTSGDTVFGGAVKAASVTTDADGTLAINGGSVDTTGAQSYGERAVLGADT
ncbi:filamentous hemagglutinin N-terminal domain-containing protein, partial [Pigmentiphaga soli]|uniref:beta strand repeat-containing protein n=1 Tax=Pigmentiphaga soli TaxID=1007095 RepID=UPI0031F16023